MTFRITKRQPTPKIKLNNNNNNNNKIGKWCDARMHRVGQNESISIVKGHRDESVSEVNKGHILFGGPKVLPKLRVGCDGEHVVR